MAARSETDKQMFSIAEFSARQGISISTYYKIRAAGHGPKTVDIGGRKITLAEEEAWIAREAKRALGKEAQLKAQRRSENARQAGLAAAASPKHISKKNKERREQQPSP